jgi:O-acetyl-ADP-ribose deacetylase (regulator of RNase III)
MSERLMLRKGDITDMNVDAIVNAANTDLELGAGVAGAIRVKGGPAIQQECNEIGPVEPGEAAITTGGNLKAHYVIHAASMHVGGRTSRMTLEQSVANSLRIANEKQLKTIAFPAIGTGIARFPMDECAQIMIDEILRHLQGPTSLEKVYIVLYDLEAYTTFEKELMRRREETS